MANALGPTQVMLGHDSDGRPVAWDWYRDPNMLIGGAAGWGKSFTAKGLMQGMARAATQGTGGGVVLWNPKRVGWAAWEPHLLHPAWKSDFLLSDVSSLWLADFSPWLWEQYLHRMRAIEQLDSQGIDEFRAAGFAPLTVVVEELQGMFQVLDAQDPKNMKAIQADLSTMTALFRASGIRFVFISQAMTAEGGIPTKAKTNCTARLWVGPIDDGGFVACFGQSKPQDFANKYRPVLGSGIFQCPDIGTRAVSVAFE